VALSPLLASYDAVLLDLDGCVWIGDEATPRAAEALAALRGAGKKIAFVTNEARRSPEDLVRKLWSMGLQASLDEVVTVGSTLQFHLATAFPGGAAAVVIGSPAIHRHVREAGLRIVNGTDLVARTDVVVVCGHNDFDFAELREATQAVLRGAALIGAHRDATFPMPDGPWPGSGAVLASVEYATGRTAETVGKPERAMYVTALDRLGAERALVIGDKPEVDLAGARAAGLDGALVLTGGADPEGLEPPPVAVAADLGTLVLG
jgi:HAD superfamily hydrolase (TIGR01450 family)